LICLGYQRYRRLVGHADLIVSRIRRIAHLIGATYGFPFAGIYGGIEGDATVFKLSPAASGWTKTVRTPFGTIRINAPGPDSRLLSRDGAIYGTTGDLNAWTGGAVFKLTMSVLHQCGSGDIPTELWPWARRDRYTGQPVASSRLPLW